MGSLALKLLAHFRPAWSTLSRTSTVTRKPVLVLAFAINSFTTARE